MELEVGTVRPMNRSIGTALRGRGFADAWLQWAFDGWLRCLGRGGDYSPKIAASIRGETQDRFAWVDEIDAYFANGEWEPSTKGQDVCTEGLVADMLRWARDVTGHAGPDKFGVTTVSTSDAVFDSADNLADKLTRPNASQVLGKMLSLKRGFHHGTRTRSQMLWAPDRGKPHSWHVPYIWKGKSDEV